MAQRIPFDQEAEEACLGAMLLSRTAAEIAIETISAKDFYKPIYQNVFAGIADLYEHGESIDPVTVEARVREMNLSMGGDPGVLVFLQGTVPSVANVRHYAKIVERNSVARDVMRATQDALTSIMNGEDPFEVADELTRFTLGIGTTDNEQKAQTMKELAGSEDSVSPVIIPGLMAQDHRTIIVAPEGRGKSLLLKTIAQTTAQGIHPFKHVRIPPIRTLVIDCENPSANITQTGVPLDEYLSKWSHNYDETRFRIYRRPGGINLLNRRDRTDIQREIALHQPDLVCAGPVYKMYIRPKNSTYEDSADEFLRVWDDLRTKYNFALMLEMHAAKGGDGTREMDPMGSQRFMAWPEVGIGLYPSKDVNDLTLTVKKFRGDRLQGMNWPDMIDRDPNWLISGVYQGGT